MEGMEDIEMKEGAEKVELWREWERWREWGRWREWAREHHGRSWRSQERFLVSMEEMEERKKRMACLGIGI
jgi:hypothetical protein